MASSGLDRGDRYRLTSRRSPPRNSPDREQVTTTTTRHKRKASRQAEGYDLELFDPPADNKFTCPICIMVLREAVQTSCGHLFCDACITRWQREKDVCPVCNDRFVPERMFKDVRTNREVMALRVVCPNQGIGCDHTGELLHLQSHLQQCSYEKISCPNNCGMVLRRREMKNHATKECPLRSVECSQCGKAGISYLDIKRHDAECPEVDLTCDLCEMKYIRRSEEKHRSTCGKKVKCFFSEYGCNHELNRGERDIHETQFLAHHLRLLAMSRSPHLAPANSTSSQSSPIVSIAVSSHKDAGFVSGGSAFPSSSSGGGGHGPMMHSIRLDDSTDLVVSTSTVDRSKGISSTYTDSGASFDASEEDKRASTYPIDDRNSRQKDIFLVEQRQRQTINNLRDLVKNHERLISDQQAVIRRHESTINRMEHHVREHEARMGNGMYIWRIREYRRRKGDAVAGKVIVHHSPGFYTSFYGYKMCIRINLNGVDSGSGSHMALFIHLMQGECDDVLRWPFQGKITLSILDQNDATDRRRDITETLIAKPDLAAFLRPTAKRNHKGFGYIEFAPIGVIEGGGGHYVKNDTLIVKAIVEPSKELFLGNH